MFALAGQPTFFLYRIVCNPTSRVYIGQTCQRPSARFAQHLRNPPPAMQADLARHGAAAFSTSVLFSTPDRNLINRLERQAIAEERMSSTTSTRPYNRLFGHPRHDPRLNVIIDAARRRRASHRNRPMSPHRSPPIVQPPALQPLPQLPAEVVDLTLDSDPPSPPPAEDPLPTSSDSEDVATLHLPTP
jgi:hypothetical protein